MLSLGIDKAKEMFFDSKRVMDATTRAERQVLSRFGAFVRQTARSSIRRRKGVSLPGSPPSSHTGLLKQFIYFSYDPIEKRVIIGPARLNKPGLATRLLELGGASNLLRRRQVVQAQYKARPYMLPAFRRELAKMPAMFEGSIRP